MAKREKSEVAKTEAKTESKEVVQEIIERPAEETDSPNWTKFILSQLRPEEIVEGSFPTTDGLRRVFEKFMGTILSTKATVCDSPNMNNGGRATVTVEIIYEDRKNRAITISDGADCGSINTEAPYSVHPTATAITRAEGRCLRKGLRLQRVITADEKSNVDPQIQQIEEHAMKPPISAGQKSVIVSLCARNSIDLNKFLKSQQLDQELASLNALEAQELLRVLNAYNRGPDNKDGLAIPDSIKKS